ncbi:hypothetical protein HMN09_00118400 [Mycena chlorophos]|uniref:Acyl-CoA oxidase C-alpha1 domain-containing protein n=1 Tax=Mycena chlorophos TaxID=658473 RepID=A0A8H6TQH6_MYCCL|nr:hypothetical protein HMN09_00118400 [Mycena chlorophos]
MNVETTPRAPTQQSRPPTYQLLDTELFRRPTHSRVLTSAERVQISFAKARNIVEFYALSLEDIRSLSQAFWDLYSDPIIANDSGATTFIAIQYNLVIGTILDLAGSRVDSDLRVLLDDLLHYRVQGSFCLTELDHGLDAANIETTAEELADGSGYIIHTPHPGAAKFMPPTVPCGLPSVGIIMARLKRNNIDCGIRPFLVHLHDGKNMQPGVVSRKLPDRGGSSPVWHAITSFDNVRLPAGALLGSADATLSFAQTIWRIAVGSLSLTAVKIVALAYSACIVARYSQRRLTAAGGGSPRPIISFPTQHGPILKALSQSIVLAQFYKYATKAFSMGEESLRVRHGIATCFKVVALRMGLQASLELSERCGAQGLFNYNRLSESFLDLRGIAIAEGDALGLSIRLAIELLQGRYTLDEVFFAHFTNPLSSSEDANPLARHASELLIQTRAMLARHWDNTTPGAGPDERTHRSEHFARLVLPQCKRIVEAIGTSYAYASAVDAGVPEPVLRLFLATEMREDEAWYIEHLGMTQVGLFEAEVQANQDALPHLEEWLEMSGVERYIEVPIMRKEWWDDFVETLPVYKAAKL